MIRAQRAVAVEELLPSGAVAFEIHGDASPEALFPSERDCVSRAVEKRIREFAAGRLCARAGLEELGLEAVPLPSRRDRTTLWPPGVVGSITHTEGYCLAVVGLRRRFAALGVDAEWIGAVDPELWRLTMSAEELAALLNLDECARHRAATVLFGAKEAFYKCQYVLTRRWLGFEDVVASVAGNTFSLTVIEPTHPLHRDVNPHVGHFKVGGELVIAAIAMPADSWMQIVGGSGSCAYPTISSAVSRSEACREAPSHALSSDQGMP